MPFSYTRIRTTPTCITAIRINACSSLKHLRGRADIAFMRPSIVPAVLAIGIALLNVGLARAATVAGSLAEPGVVWISDGSVTHPDEAQVHNENREFIPGTMVIRAGANVRFPNDDPFFHSIYSSSAADPFDIGYYGYGPGKVVNFAHAGIVEVRCHIHAKMHGTLVVTDGPSSEGMVTSFKLNGVLPGAHRLNVWTPRSGVKTVSVNVKSDDAALDLGMLRLTR